jgi:hypothetical protein
MGLIKIKKKLLRIGEKNAKKWLENLVGTDVVSNIRTNCRNTTVLEEIIMGILTNLI